VSEKNDTQAIRHHIGILGGSGLYDLEGLSDVDERFITTPFGEPSDAIVMGRLGDTKLYFLPRHGRGHKLPPHRLPYRANIYALKWLGAQQIVSVSAVGSLRENLHPGDFVLIDQFIDRTRSRVSTFFDDDGVVAHVSCADPVDARLAEHLATAAEKAGATVHRGGTYVCMEGPQFSTRAESHMYRAWGAHVIGMTNLPEAKLAREAELPYASVAMVTDYDCWHEEEEAVSVQNVIAVLQKNVSRARDMIRHAGEWPDPTASPAARALEHAIITHPAAITPRTKEKLSLLIGKYVQA
jgi:5'-methylthioadenosine phosphorylase